MPLESLRQPGWRDIEIEGVSEKGQANQAVSIFGNDSYRTMASTLKVSVNAGNVDPL
jgi:hypothetical protein